MIQRSTILAIAFLLTGLAAQETGTKDAETQKKPVWTGVLDEKDFAALHQLKDADEAAPPLRGSKVAIGDAVAYLSLPKLGPGETPKAAVLVIHEWWGLNEHIQRWTDRLAADGYAALAVDLYGGTVATTREEAMAAMRGVDESKALATLRAAHGFLASDERVRAKKRAVIGWCFGGGWSLRLAMAQKDLDAAVLYYGSLVDDPARLASIEAKVLGVFGTEDRSIPMDKVKAFETAMQKAGKSIEVLRFDAQHAFANPSSARYDEKSASAAWARVRSFLDENLRAATGSFQVGERELRFVVPSGWKLGALKPMRNVNFAFEGSLQCYVSVLGGAGGGLGPNIKRWQAQLGATPSSDEDIAKLPKLEVLGREAVLATIDGAFDQDGKQIEARMYGLVCPLEAHVIFVKMIGPKALVEAEEARFRAFCKSLR